MNDRHLHGVTSKINTNDIAAYNVDKHSQNDQQELNNKLSWGHDQHWFDTGSHRNKEYQRGYREPDQEKLTEAVPMAD